MASAMIKGKMRTVYNYIGKKNKTTCKGFVKVCKLPQDKLKDHLTNFLVAKGYDIVRGDGYLYGRGNIPVLVTAHMDTVHKENVKDFYEYTEKTENGKRHIISSPQGIGGDDRCGIYMIKQIIKAGLKPYVLFCEDEEIGGVGSDKFCCTEYIDELKDMLFLIELDRANANDLVYYDDENYDFHKFCETTTGYKMGYGSFSDISNLSPACEISSVNISCGYYNAHTTSEYVVLEEMEASIKATIKLINEGVKAGKAYEYKHKSLYSYGSYGYGYGSKYNWYDNYYDSYTSKRTNTDTVSTTHKANKAGNNEWKTFVFRDENEFEYVVEGRSLEEAYGNLAMIYSEMCWSNIYDYDEYTSEEWSVYKTTYNQDDNDESEQEEDEDVFTQLAELFSNKEEAI